MLRHTKYRPYIRRMRPSDTSSGFDAFLKLRMFQLAGVPAFVLVQRGCRHHVMNVARTRRELMKKPFPVAVGRKTFRQWVREVQAYASGEGR